MDTEPMQPFRAEPAYPPAPAKALPTPGVQLVEWGRWYGIGNKKRPVGWLFTAYRWEGDEWVEWFSIPESRFAIGYSRALNRIRRYLLEGEHPDALAHTELANLHQHWTETGRHALARDNQGGIYDPYGLDQS
jgi:hypothetical protein